MTGIDRLKMLSEGTKNQSLIKILNYLETRPDMNEKYLNEEKTPEQMWKYITKKAKEQAIDNCAVIDDRVVFVWAISYFLATNEALGLNKKDSPPPTSNVSKNSKDTEKNKIEVQDVQNNVIDIQTAKEQSQLSIF